MEKENMYLSLSYIYFQPLPDVVSTAKSSEAAAASAKKKPTLSGSSSSSSGGSSGSSGSSSGSSSSSGSEDEAATASKRDRVEPTRRGDLNDSASEKAPGNEPVSTTEVTASNKIEDRIQEQDSKRARTDRSPSASPDRLQPPTAASVKAPEKKSNEPGADIDLFAKPKGIFTLIFFS